ncbi:Ion transporter, partial [Fischerella thermalis CCMEE 5205]
MLLTKEKTAFYLADLETPVGKLINLTIAGLVLLSSGIFVAETYNIPDVVRFHLNILDNIILFIFALEYFLRFW